MQAESAMRVRVDQSRHDDPAAKVNDASLCPS
jgi:hypothetical protein